MRPIDQQVILVTGSTDGLGRAVARAVAEQGATVLLHGRDAVRLEATVLDIRGATDNERVVSYLADLGSLAQVRSLGEQVLAKHDRLDVLVSNAGIGSGGARGRREVSDDGYELRFAVNYLAGFLLTTLLRDRLVAAAPARVVNVASAGQMAIDFDDVMLERDYSGVRAYCQSKLAQIMQAIDVAESVPAQEVTANSLHPATFMPTKMVLEERGESLDSLELGTRAVVRLAVEPELDGITGRFFDRLDEAAAHPQAYDPQARAALRRLSEELVGARLS